MLIAIAGNIGAGKTTLVSRLSAHFSYRPFYEAVSHNPYLQDFYKDMQRWAFPLQVYFLGHRFRQSLHISRQKTGVVLDRTIYEDAHVFAYNLYSSGLMTERDYQNYLNMYESMVEFAPAPDLLIYLKSNVNTLSQRIVERTKGNERSFEKEIPLQYLMDLNACYERWIASYQLSPVLTVDIAKQDLAEDAHFKKLVKNIESYKHA